MMGVKTWLLVMSLSASGPPALVPGIASEAECRRVAEQIAGADAQALRGARCVEYSRTCTGRYCR
jgi:hypothetical protein